MIMVCVNDTQRHAVEGSAAYFRIGLSFLEVTLFIDLLSGEKSACF